MCCFNYLLLITLLVSVALKIVRLHFVFALLFHSMFGVSFSINKTL